MVTATQTPDLLSADTFKDGPPHALFDLLRAERPVYGQPDRLNGGTAWSLTRYDDIRAVSIDQERFTITKGHQYPTPRSYAETMGDALGFTDPPRHTRLRSFSVKAFSPSVVRKFDQWIRDVAVSIVDRIEQSDRLDIVPEIAAELPGQVICSIMGVPDADRRHLIGWASDIFGRVDPAIGLEKAMAAVGTVRDYAAELCAEKRRKPAVDMTTELLTASYEDEPITPSELYQQVLSLILAGFETTHTLIAQSLLLMAQDEDVRQQIYTAPREELGNYVEELLRFVSPVMHMLRTANHDLEMHGQRISAGDSVIMWFTAGNRDPAQFKQPHRYIGARGRRTHLAFGGGGPHFCIGSHLARLEAEILFDEMRKRNLRLDLAGNPVRSVGIFINALREVPMRVVR